MEPLVGASAAQWAIRGSVSAGPGFRKRSIRATALIAHFRGLFWAASGAEPIRVFDEFIEP